ncbi:MAG TPA: helix-turn-helix domain-containing protein [Ignavibacteria bacterium]|nr:helix-turn-helix domain-containing protein [Ignavibacteria bacterium]
MQLAKINLKVFGFEIEFEDLTLNEISMIPFIYKEIYNFQKAKILGVNVLIVKQKNKLKISANNYRKHSDILYKSLGIKVIFLLNNLLPYNRNRLMEKKVNFVMANKQVFLPDLLVNITNFRLSQDKNITKLSPVTQFLILYHLLKNSIEYKSIDEISRETNYSKMSISRAIKELKETGLCKEKRNKEVEIYFNKTKQEIWNESLPYMSSPVVKTYFNIERLENHKFLTTNLSALSHYTNIADDGQKRIAIYKNEFYEMINQRKLSLNEIEGEEFIEVWKYQPQMLSDTNYIDPLSLYLIFKDTEDERIESALEKLINIEIRKAHKYRKMNYNSTLHFYFNKYLPNIYSVLSLDKKIKKEKFWNEKLNNLIEHYGSFKIGQKKETNLFDIIEMAENGELSKVCFLNQIDSMFSTLYTSMDYKFKIKLRNMLKGTLFNLNNHNYLNPIGELFCIYKFHFNNETKILDLEYELEKNKPTFDLLIELNNNKYLVEIYNIHPNFEKENYLEEVGSKIINKRRNKISSHNLENHIFLILPIIWLTQTELSGDNAIIKNYFDNFISLNKNIIMGPFSIYSNKYNKNYIYKIDLLDNHILELEKLSTS